MFFCNMSQGCFVSLNSCDRKIPSHSTVSQKLHKNLQEKKEAGSKKFRVTEKIKGVDFSKSQEGPSSERPGRVSDYGIAIPRNTIPGRFAILGGSGGLSFHAAAPVCRQERLHMRIRHIFLTLQRARSNRVDVIFYFHSCSDGVNDKKLRRAAAGTDPVLASLPPVGGRTESAIHEPLHCQLRTPGPTPSTRSPLTSAIGLKQPQTCRPVFNLKQLMRGPMSKVPEGLLSRNECIELLPRQAVHDSPNVFVEIGLPHLCRLTQAYHFVEGTRRAQ